jgi:tetratricopeptide (TPR) repeat protein
MNKTIALLGLSALLLMAPLSNQLDSLNSRRNQFTSGIIPPISLCGSPGARTILKLMDTTKQMAPLMSNLGKYGMPIQTKSERAQLFFNQGINLYYGFNHLEAYRSFREVARLDPENAMAYWGQALSLGPNINLPMDPADTEVVFKAVQKALSLSDRSLEKERLLIQAISKRYSAEALENRKPLDEAYANAMAELANKYLTDSDVQTLYAEALMDLHPWDFWKKGKPQPWTSLPIEIIKNVINKNPDHPGANHLNIHILEASAKPDDATASADRLRTLVPGAGHLVHMPSHIYIRTGRYQDGIEANEKAVKMDLEYITQCKVQGVYPLFYFPHNYHFLWACALMTGQEKKSMETATALMKTIPVELMGVKDYVTLQHWYAVPWYTMVRFGEWNEILQIPKPIDSLLYLKSVWHYARGMANVRLNNIKLADEELKQMEKIVSEPTMKELTIGGFNSFEKVLSIGVNILDGEINAARKDYTKASAALRKAIEIEDGLLYQEPPDWYHPSRQLLGAILLEDNKPSEAEIIFKEDLAIYPANGWSLFGLSQSLQKQGKKKDADATMKLFKEAFKNADVRLTSARK